MNFRKHCLLLLTLGISYLSANAQLKLGKNARVIQNSSIIELESTTQGLLLPRMNTIQRDSISNHTSFNKDISHGLLIYNTDHNCINFYDSSSLGGWTNPCIPVIPIYNENALASVDTPKVGGIIVTEDLDFLIYKDSAWNRVKGADEWSIDTIEGQPVYVFTSTLLHGDTVVITKGGKLGINRTPVQYAIDILHTDSLLMRVENNNIAELTIETETDSTIAIETNGTPIKLQVGNVDSLNHIAIDKLGGVHFSEYGLGTFTSPSPSYALGVDSAGKIIELTGITWSSSDSRLKKSINKLNQSSKKLSLLSGYTYYWNHSHPTKKFGKHIEYGILADEMNAVFPDLVKKDRHGYYEVNYIGLIPVLIEANKEQQEQIDHLEERIEKLERLLDKK